MANMEDLKRRILRVIANCNKPKVTNQPLGQGETCGRGPTATQLLGLAHFLLCLLLPFEQTFVWDSI